MKPIILAAMNDSQFTEDILKCAKQVAPDVEWVLPN